MAPLAEWPRIFLAWGNLFRLGRPVIQPKLTSAGLFQRHGKGQLAGVELGPILTGLQAILVQRIHGRLVRSERVLEVPLQLNGFLLKLPNLA